MHAVTNVPSTIVIVGRLSLAKGGAGDLVHVFLLNWVQCGMDRQTVL